MAAQHKSESPNMPPPIFGGKDTQFKKASFLMTTSISPLMPGPVIQCMATGRDPTEQEHLDVAKRIWTDGAVGRSAFGWERLSAGSRDRLLALRNALLALNGDEGDGRTAKACTEEQRGPGSAEFETGQSTSNPDKSVKVMKQRGKAFGLQGPSRRAALALSSFSKQFDRDDLHSRFLTAAQSSEGQNGHVVTESDGHRLQNFLAIEPGSNRILATATVAIEQSTRIAKAVLVISPKFEKGGIRWKLLDQVARFAANIGAKTLEAIENRKEQGSLNLECHAGWSAAPYRVDPTLMVLRKALNGHRS